jgi:hypothetical protein
MKQEIDIDYERRAKSSKTPQDRQVGSGQLRGNPARELRIDAQVANQIARAVS